MDGILTRIRTLSPGFENNDTLKCGSHNFPRIPHMSALTKLSFNYILMYGDKVPNNRKITGQIGLVLSKRIRTLSPGLKNNEM